MRKHLRKKLYIGEFKELGFEPHFTINPEHDEAAQDRLLDAFLIEAVEARNLAFGGGGHNGKWSGFVAKFSRGSASEEDQSAVEQWLKNRTEVVSYKIGSLADAWYPGGTSG